MHCSWNMTNQCNMFCDHCYREAGARLDDELTTAQGKKLIDEIKQAGFSMLILSGGEPLMRPDVYEIIAYARERGLRVVMGSNGSLITPEVASKLKTSGLMGIGVSLDSIHPDKNDRFRKLPGAYDATLAGMTNLREAGVRFQVHTTVMDWNVDELEAICDLAIEQGAMAFHVFFLVPTGRAVNIADEALRVKEYEHTLIRLMQKQKAVPIEIKPTCAPQFVRIADKLGVPSRFTRGCLAGTDYCIISPRGDVQPCAYLNIKLGNVKEESFVDIWEHHPVFTELRTLDYKGKCGICDYKERCGGCRARAYFYQDNDYMAADEWCLHHPPAI